MNLIKFLRTRGSVLTRRIGSYNKTKITASDVLFDLPPPRRFVELAQWWLVAV